MTFASTLSRRLPLALLLAACVAPVATAQFSTKHAYGAPSPSKPAISVSFGPHGPSVRATYHAPRRVWVQGCWTVVPRRVWVPGGSERRWVPATHRTVWDACGRPAQVLARPGHWAVVATAGRWETRRERVWKPGHWRTVGC